MLVEGTLHARVVMADEMQCVPFCCGIDEILFYTILKKSSRILNGGS